MLVTHDDICFTKSILSDFECMAVVRIKSRLTKRCAGGRRLLRSSAGDRFNAVFMVHAANDKHITHQAHRRENKCADKGKPKDSTKHNFRGTYRLSDDRVDCAILDVSWQAERADQKRENQYQI